MQNKTYAIILAGGEGLRFAGYSVNSLPKQFAKVGDKSVLEMSIDAFEESQHIDRIIVVMNPKYLKQAQDLIENNKYKKIVDIIRGGATRFDSSYYGLKRCLQGHHKTADTIKVLIHDGVRPFVSAKLIKNVVNALNANDGVEPILPMTQTLVQKIGEHWLTQDRDNYALVQTPQGFWLNLIADAYKTVIKEYATWVPTDDISVLQKINPHAKIQAIEGDQHNKKITFPEDL